MNSIRSKITASIILASIIPLFILIYFQNQSLNNYKNEATTEMMDAAYLVSNSVNRYAIERSNDLKMLASSITIMQGFGDNKVEDLLNTFMIQEKSFRLLCVKKGKGNFIGHVIRLSDNSLTDDMSAKESCTYNWIDKVENIQSISDDEAVTSYETTRILLSSHSIDTQVLPLSIHLNSSKENKIIVYAHIEMQAFYDLLYEGVQSLNEMGVDNVVIDLIDSQGAILYRDISESRKVLPETSVSQEIAARLKYHDANQNSVSADKGWLFTEMKSYSDEQLVNYYRVAKTDDALGLRWTVIMLQPSDELYASINKYYYIALVVFVLTIILSILIGFITSNFITSPLRSLVHNVDSFRKGEADVEIKGGGRSDEVGKLANAFRLLCNSQIERNELLESYSNQHQKLKSAQDQASQLLMTSPEAMIIVDADGIILTVNPAAEKLFGYKKNELLSQSVEVLIPTRYRNHKELRNSYIKHPEYRPMGNKQNLHGLRKDGSEFLVSISLSPVESYEGRKVIATIRDETIRAQYESELRKLAAVAEHTTNLVIVTDRWGRIEWVNMSFEHKTGYQLHEVRGKKPGDVMQGPDTDKNAIRRMRDALRNSEAIRLEVLNYTKDMKPIWLDMNIQPVMSERGIEHYISIESDVTDRKKLEEDLINTNVNLELRVKERTQQLEGALEKADQAANAKSAFLATMSHEIRTPMNGVLGMVELIQNTTLDDKQASMLNTVKNSSNALLGIIDDILDFSKIEAGKLELVNEEKCLVEIVDEVVDSISTLAINKKINIIVTQNKVLPTFLCDPLRIRQVLLNLIGNAIKFTDNNGYVLINIELESIIENTGYVDISIKDNGIGIDDDKQLHLFQPFTQADESTTRKYGGTGLGLSICGKLIELMGGDIKLESSAGNGSTFTIMLSLEIATNAEETDDQKNDVAFIIILKNVFIKKYVSEMLSELEYKTYVINTPNKIENEINNILAKTNKRVLIITDCYENNYKYELADLVEDSNINGVDVDILFMISIYDNSEYNGYTFIYNPLHVTKLMKYINKIIAGDASECNLPSGTRGKNIASSDNLNAYEVLVAEDNEINQNLIELQLNEIGIKHHVVGNGIEALEAWSERDFDLLLTDCHMPVMDGFELTKAIRDKENEYGYDRLPIIAITANAQKGEYENCISKGMDDYLSKPVKLASLRNKILKWLDISSRDGAETCVDSNDSNKIIDLSVISSLVGNDQNKINRFLLKFIETVPSNISEIDMAIKARTYKDVKSYAHKLKSSSKVIGAHTLTRLCQDLENVSLYGDLDVVEDLYNELSFHYKECEIYINEIITKANMEVGNA